MENAIVLINKEQYALRKTSREIAITNKILSSIVDKLPKEYFEKGEYYFNKSDFREAIKWYSMAIEHKSDFAITYCKRGFSNINIGEVYNGIADFDKAIYYRPDFNEAYYGRAITKGLGLMDFEGAIEDFNKAIELEPKDAYAYLFRGHAKQFTGNLKGALEDLIKARKNIVENDWLKVNREFGIHGKMISEQYVEGLLKTIEKDYITYCTIENLSNEIEHNKNNEVLYFTRAIEKGKLKRYSNAIADFQISIHLKGGNTTIYNNISMSFFYLGNDYFNSKQTFLASEKYTEAIAYCNKAIELDKNYSNAYLIRGASKRMLGDKNGACADLNRAHELGDSRAIDFINEYCKK